MDDFNLKVPMNGEARTRVSGDNTALKFGSGSIDVFGTPAMIALMEESSVNTVDKILPEGYKYPIGFCGTPFILISK